jgi:hypothetical protein
VALFAVVDEAGFQRRFDAGDDRLVDVALALFAPFDFDFVVEQFLPVQTIASGCVVLQFPVHMPGQNLCCDV